MQTPYWYKQSEPDGADTITITLWPYRSLGPRGFLMLMLGIASLAFGVSLFFFLLGAWPVIGFMGVEIGLVWYLFQRNYRAGQISETLSIQSHRTGLTRMNWRGQTTTEWLDSPWLRAEILSSEGRQDRLMLRLHGRMIEIGSFLPPIEKPALAEMLNHSFSKYQTGAA